MTARTALEAERGGKGALNGPVENPAFPKKPQRALPSAKVELYTAFVSSGLKKAEFARIGIPTTHIDRLFSLRYHSRFHQIEAAFVALGKRLKIVVRDAA